MADTGGSGPQSGSVLAHPLNERLLGRVLVLALNRPPVNALSADLRAALWESLTKAEADPAIGSVLLTGDDRLFSAGADLGEIDKPAKAPLLSDLCARIEGFAKPVIVALRGQVLGGGLELALAAHYRLADAGAVLGFPEVALGLVPGAGGTQRLPRLIGAQQALRLIVSGKPVMAPEALALGLVDQVHERGVMPAALMFARKMPAPRRTLDQARGLRDVAAYQDAVRRARKALAGSALQAPMRAVDCVEAAMLLPAPQALDYERSAFDELATSPDSLALRHLFRAERRAARQAARGTAAMAEPGAPQLDKVALWGAGGDSADLAARMLSSGLRVTLADSDRDRLVAALRRIAEQAEAQVAAGTLTPEARDADWARLSSILAPDGLIGADLVLVQPTAPPLPAALSDLPVVASGGLPPKGGALVGLTFGPGTLVEVAQEADSPPGRVAGAVALARRLGGQVVMVGRGANVAARLAAARPTGLAVMANEGAHLLAEGIVRRPGDIDVVAVHAGLVARVTGGPMYQADLRGLLVLRAELKRLAADPAVPLIPAPLFNDLIRNGKRLDSLNV